MLVEARIVNADPENPVAVYQEGQELEGPAAELQVALGHAVALPDAPVAPAEPEPATKSKSTPPRKPAG